MSEEKKAVIYIRETPEHKRDFQLNEIETYASQNGFKIVGKYIDSESCDLSKSPALNEMLVDVVLEKFKYILVYRINKFSWKMTDVVQIYDYLFNIDIYIVSVMDPVDTSNPKGRMMLELFREWGNMLRELLG